jgi:hypothetical protein
VSERHPDRLTAIASGLVAALALAVSTYNVILQRQQIRAQVWPHLSWTYSERDPFTMQLSNEGVGPAIIKSVEVTVDNQPVADWRDAFVKLGISLDEFGFSSLSGKVIPANEDITAVSVANDARSKRLVQAFGDRLMLHVCYCSVLDECWDLDGPVKSCFIPRVRFQQ